MSKVYRLTKVAIAVDQLDWAIRLLIDHDAYVPAIGLAGAAEEILGRFAGDQASFHVLKAALASEHSLTEKDIADNYLNDLKNWIKHCSATDANVSRDFDRPELEAAVVQMIVRALHNLALYDRSGPSELLRFMEWLDRVRPDLV